MKTTTQTAATNTRTNSPIQPTHVAKVRHGFGKTATYERVGVAWLNTDGSLYVKLAGTQIVSALMLYELDGNTQSAEASEE